ncbi:hypothetical protein HRI_003372200 [Hibiscus trionum]|uniref:Uncharacterized protein n=1 Tax=Hibiscus trionum TaxID=183268 RepID=A0A9W7IJ29_HIBTR|nr:hypothetical protein HRI_003372200 [Hibiscus trionum]
MKTVTGKILSSTPISVSKAAKIISNFVSTDNGASQAISAYLRRASSSFGELKQFHRELQKPSRSNRNHKKSKSDTTVDGARESSLEPSVFNSIRENVEPSQEASHGYLDGERKKHKKKEKGDENNFQDGGSKIGIEDGESKRKEEKSEGKFGEDEKSGKKIENLEENGVITEKGEMRDGGEREGDKKKKKKRKSRDIGEGIENNASSEPRKKKIKNEVDK